METNTTATRVSIVISRGIAEEKDDEGVEVLSLRAALAYEVECSWAE